MKPIQHQGNKQSPARYTLAMNLHLIKELERSIRHVREKTMDFNTDELLSMQSLLTNAGYSLALELYSRERESLESASKSATKDVNELSGV